MNPLSKFSIHQQILIGSIPVLALLVILVLTSYQNFRKFDLSLNSYTNITKENLLFRDIEKDVVELQRNVLVYSYVDYDGVLKKVEFLQGNLENKFNQIEETVAQDEEIKDRFDRMVGHYVNYKSGFSEAVKEKIKLKEINDQNLKPLSKEIKEVIQRIQEEYVSKSDFKAAYKLRKIENKFFQSSANIVAFSKSPDSTFIIETRILIEEISTELADIAANSENTQFINDTKILNRKIESYQSVFEDLIRINQTYLYLINVVLAGKASEMGALSSELDDLITRRAGEVSEQIKRNIVRTQSQFTILAIIAGIIGLLSSILVAKGIARPVSNMAKTLYSLSLGQSDVQIPGQSRKDEVGQMAIAANEFKLMAYDLENQTKELEEFSYRTSHDLRSPLISSVGLIDVALESIDEKDFDTAKVSLSHAQKSLRSLEKLVQDILDLTKIKNYVEGVQKINLKKIIDDTLDKLSHMDNYDRLLIEKNINVETSLIAQKTRVVLLLENLISNAIKYQDPEEEKPFVKIKAFEDQNDIVIDIEDNGLGIPKDYQDDLFTMFKRFHPKVSFGSGLGMYMMRKSADVLEGTINYEDTGNGNHS